MKYGGEDGENAKYFPARGLFLSGVHRVQHDGPDPGPRLQLGGECDCLRGENCVQSERSCHVSSHNLDIIFIYLVAIASVELHMSQID